MINQDEPYRRFKKKEGVTMRKKAFLLAAVLTLFTVQASASEYRVFVNDIEIQDSDAFIDENSRTQMPVRKVSEALGCDVAWDPVTYEVTVTNNSDVIRMIIGKSVLYKNDDIIYMDTSARLVNDRTYIPVRYLAEALDCEIKYEKDDKAVYIVQGDSGIMEITGTEDPSINTNPRGLFAQDFSTIDPTPLADEWYTKDSIPDEILTALNKPVGYIGEKITRTIEDIGTGGSYKLANGTYTQEFMFGGNSSNFCTDAILNSSTGRLALMIESESISSDDLWIDVTLHEMRESGNGNQPFFKEAWHKTFDNCAVIVFDELDTSMYYNFMISDVIDQENNPVNYSGTITIAEF